MSTIENFDQLLEDSLPKYPLHPGSLIQGKVVRITKDYAMVDAGLKSESLIPIEQFYGENNELEIKVDDQVTVMLEAIEDGFGETHLSREKAKRAEAWVRLQKALKNNENVYGWVTGKVKGGFTVDLGAVRGFLPGSLVDVRPVRDTNFLLEGEEHAFKVVKLDPKRNNIVLSRRAVLEIEGQAGRQLALSSLQEGEVRKGIVKNLADYGAFIDLGGIDGLLHMTDISWKRIKHPSEILMIGDEIEVIILKIDRERSRISLGLKQLEGDPWNDLIKRYPIHTRLIGQVTNIMDYGCFVELENGIEGLVHVSEMDWTNKNVNPNKLVHPGSEIEVMVLDIDVARRRISLGIKQCQPNPWEIFSNQHVKGESIHGKIKSITDFGIFVGLEGGIDGLVHLSDISWTISGEEAVRQYKKGDDIETVILSIDPERERVSLGIKQLESDPQALFLTQYPQDSIVSARVLSLDEVVKVDLGNHLEGYLQLPETQDVFPYQVGDEIKVKILGLDRKAQHIFVELATEEVN
jgi:small subunit ribosomal protein S1